MAGWGGHAGPPLQSTRITRDDGDFLETANQGITSFAAQAQSTVEDPLTGRCFNVVHSFHVILSTHSQDARGDR